MRPSVVLLSIILLSCSAKTSYHPFTKRQLKEIHPAKLPWRVTEVEPYETVHDNGLYLVHYKRHANQFVLPVLRFNGKCAAYNASDSTKALQLLGSLSQSFTVEQTDNIRKRMRIFTFIGHN